MQSPVQIAFHGLDPSPSLRHMIEELAVDLDEHYGQITVIRVVVELPHRHHHQGKHFRVHMQIGVPGGEVVVDRETGRDTRHEDARLAVRDAFHTARRRLRDYFQRRRGQVKHHPPQGDSPVG